MLNGTLVAWVGVSPILATLGTMTLISGLNILLSNGTVISGFPAAIQYLGNATIVGIPVALLLFLVVALLLWVLLEHTTLGRSLYLVGSNEQATRYSGVNTVRVQIAVYVISALLGWVAAILMMAKFNSAKAGYGESYLLVTILPRCSAALTRTAASVACSGWCWRWWCCRCWKVALIY